MDIFDIMHPGSFSDNPPASVVETFSPLEGFKRNQSFAVQMHHFIETAWGESEPVCSFEGCIKVLRFALGARASVLTGNLVTL